MKNEILNILREISYINKYTNELDALRDIGYILRYLNDGIYVANVDGTTLMVNDAFERISGIPRDEIIKRNVSELENEGYWSRSAAAEAIETGKMATITQVYPNGKTGLVTSTPIRDENGELIRIVSTIRDITELSLLSRQIEQKDMVIDRYKDMLSDIQEERISGLIYKSKRMEQTMIQVKKAAEVDSNVLLMGETGSGKSTFAKLIGKLSARRDKPFIEVNCGAIPSQLFESELFGYERGAFTGASAEGKVGLAEMADKGVLFLDEISELSLNDQTKLLLFIDTKRLMKVGGKKTKKVDVRIIAAGNRDLKEMVQNGEFRKDLYYRLNVIAVHIPPLRERSEDIISLTLQKIEEFNKANKLNKRLTSEAMDALLHYEWPGNIRELMNVIERACVLSDGETIGVDDFPYEVRTKGMPAARATAFEGPGTDAGGSWPVDMKSEIERMEKEWIRKALEEGGSVRKAADLLKMDPTALQRRKKKYNI